MTKGEIDRLGTRITESEVISSIDLQQLQDYRRTFHEPLARVFSFVLEHARKIDKKCIVTYRIKRIDTIIEKLKRFEDNQHGHMALSRMGDIGGCRCIFSNTRDIFMLKQHILAEYGENCKIHDYIESPKESGYRSLHIYVKDTATNKSIEIQIRDKEQHNWATLVEIIDLLYGSKNKEQGINGKLGQFLYLYSQASSLSEDDFSSLVINERKMKVFENMSSVLNKNYLNIRLQWLRQQQKGEYYVIIANKSKSEIFSFPSFEEAEKEYYKQYLENSDCNVVLTHIKNADFQMLNMAYSNYVLAMHAFFDEYRTVLADRIVYCVENNHYFHFSQYFRAYTSNFKCHYTNLSNEIKTFDNCSKDCNISRNQFNKWNKDLSERIKQWTFEMKTFLTMLQKKCRNSFVWRTIVLHRINRLAKVITD